MVNFFSVSFEEPQPSQIGYFIVFFCTFNGIWDSIIFSTSWQRTIVEQSKVQTQLKFHCSEWMNGWTKTKSAQIVPQHLWKRIKEWWNISDSKDVDERCQEKKNAQINFEPIYWRPLLPCINACSIVLISSWWFRLHLHFGAAIVGGYCWLFDDDGVRCNGVVEHDAVCWDPL